MSRYRELTFFLCRSFYHSFSPSVSLSVSLHLCLFLLAVDAISSFKFQPCSLHNNGLEPVIVSHINPFPLMLLLSGYSITAEKNLKQ